MSGLRNEIGVWLMSCGNSQQETPRPDAANDPSPSLVDAITNARFESTPPETRTCSAVSVCIFRPQLFDRLRRRARRESTSRPAAAPAIKQHVASRSTARGTPALRQCSRVTARGVKTRLVAAGARELGRQVVLGFRSRERFEPDVGRPAPARSTRRDRRGRPAWMSVNRVFDAGREIRERSMSRCTAVLRTRSRRCRSRREFPGSTPGGRPVRPPASMRVRLGSRPTAFAQPLGQRGWPADRLPRGQLRTTERLRGLRVSASTLPQDGALSQAGGCGQERPALGCLDRLDQPSGGLVVRRQRNIR